MIAAIWKVHFAIIILQNNVDGSREGPTTEKDSETKALDNQKKSKRRKITKDLIVVATVPELSQQELNALIEKELELRMQVKLEKERADAINAVEEYVYNMRDKIYGAYENYILEEVGL